VCTGVEDENTLEISILEDARSDLLKIAQIHLDLVGPESAKKITDKILDTIGLLRTSPKLGMEARDSKLKAAGYRVILCGNYLCFYRQIERTIVVYHIVDGRTNYPPVFEQY
jgi:plasmid stabilization system protein ParE